MDNLFKSDQPRDFWVWINPTNFLVQHNIKFTGGFTSVPSSFDSNQSLMFIPNPDFQGFISPFQNNILRNYRAEYNLEVTRERFFTDYPSRLNSIFLLETFEEAKKYRKENLQHVDNRTLEKVKTVSNYIYSNHDSAWVDFLRDDHSLDSLTLEKVTKAYWSGQKVEDSELTSFGKEWKKDTVIETLFLGQIKFYNSNLIDGG